MVEVTWWTVVCHRISYWWVKVQLPTLLDLWVNYQYKRIWSGIFWRSVQSINYYQAIYNTPAEPQSLCSEILLWRNRFWNEKHQNQYRSYTTFVCKFLTRTFHPMGLPIYPFLYQYHQVRKQCDVNLVCSVNVNIWLCQTHLCKLTVSNLTVDFPERVRKYMICKI